MKIIVSEIPEEGIDLELDEHLRTESVKILSPVHASLRIDKVGSEVLVKGTVDADVELQCSRCLKGFTMHIQSPLNVVYDPAEMISREENYKLASDELDTGFYRQDELDTDELLHEQLLLNIPMKPLCDPECKGICPRCGTDLNVSGCTCEIKEIDSRLKVLEQLLKKKE
ncbi:MAG: YceD family protein [Nitrospirota bacterium]